MLAISVDLMHVYVYKIAFAMLTLRIFEAVKSVIKVITRFIVQSTIKSEVVFALAKDKLIIKAI